MKIHQNGKSKISSTPNGKITIKCITKMRGSDSLCWTKHKSNTNVSHG